VRKVIMQPIKNIRLATQGIAAVLLFGIAFVAGADQIRRALPAPTTVQPTVVAPAGISPAGVVAPTSLPHPGSAQLPDVYIQEAILSYPDINAEFHIVFPNQPGRKAIPLNLQPTAAVPPAQGSARDSERPYPVLSCDRALTANLRVIVGNSGQKAYDGMPPQAGVALTVGGAQSSGGFATINSQQSQSVNLGPLSLKPGMHAFGIVVNSGKTGGELNFTNNTARGSFEIRCQGGSQPTPAPTQQPPKQSMGGGLRMGSALTPASQPSAQPPQGRGAEKHSTLAHAQPSQGGGVAMLNPDAACASDNTPRISNINGTQSGIAFQPGSKLNISGCGFGKGGQAYLSGGGTTVPLKIDSWDASNIHAHIDAAITGVLDIDSAKVSISPSGASVIESKNTIGKFMASRRTYLVTTNIPRYVKLVAAFNKTTLGGWGKAWLNQPVAIEHDGTVRRITAGNVERANATDELILLDPGKGFKATNLHVKWLTEQRNNGEKNVNTGHVVMFRGGNKLTPNVSGNWNLIAGDQFFQDAKDPQLPSACFAGSVAIANCVYSIYQVSVEVTGPVGVSPP
jgi:hypothetical protein